MKRLMLLLGVFLLGMPLLRAQSEAPTKKVAILEVVDRDNAINYGVKLLLRTTLAKAITQTQGYEGYDRVDMMAIQGEQDFQRTGMVSDAQIKRLGEMTGAAYVLVAEVAKIDANNMLVTAKILDVETAKLERTDYEQMGIFAKAIAAGCRKMANRMFASDAMGDNIIEKTTIETVLQKREPKEKAPKPEKVMATEYHPSGTVVFKGGKLQEMDSYGLAHKLSKVNTKLYLGNWYKDYRAAVGMRGAGIFCMAAGGSLAVAGGITAALVYIDWEDVWGACFTGGIIASVGVVLLVAGAPVYAVANKKIKRIVQAAEDQHITPPYKTACAFNFNTQYGLGINMSF